MIAISHHVALPRINGISPVPRRSLLLDNILLPRADPTRTHSIGFPAIFPFEDSESAQGSRRAVLQKIDPASGYCAVFPCLPGEPLVISDL